MAIRWNMKQTTTRMHETVGKSAGENWGIIAIFISYRAYVQFDWKFNALVGFRVLLSIRQFRAWVFDTEIAPADRCH